jgi:hypothetical protein
MYGLFILKSKMVKSSKVPKNCIGRELNKPFKSNRKFKKLQVCVKDNSEKIVNTHFGDNRYINYTIHKDKERRKRFRLRHGCDNISKLDKTSPKYFACEVLW